MPSTDETPMVFCIPGPWQDRSDLVKGIASYEPGRFLFAGGVLADLASKSHITMWLEESDPMLKQAFEIAGQGKLEPVLLDQIEQHAGVLYLEFPRDLLEQLQQVIDVTKMLQSLGGFAVKVESSGIAHQWQQWFNLLEGSEFQRYCSAVTLIGGKEYYYSCGMHLFNLPECAIARSISAEEAGALMNHFNYWRIVEDPILSSGETFSLNEDAPVYELMLAKDEQHEENDLFYNPDGVWHLSPQGADE